ncbi:MAG: hypothetical protein HZB15_07730 [Actinobacteria bacterium]|nr:hypothetical protein [Actinomycetota bacterium]
MSEASQHTVDVGAVVGLRPDALLDDIETVAGASLGHARLTLSGRAAQPRAGVLDGGVIETTRSAIAALRSAGATAWVCLLSPDVPTWFDNEGGFTDARNAGHWWPRWVEQAAQALGDDVDGWVPFEAPCAIANRLVPGNPPRHGEVVDTLLVAWRDAWRVLHGPHPIATSLDVRTVIIPRDDVDAAESARRDEHLRWRTWLRALRDGTITIPGRADRELADLAGSCDVLGIATSDAADLEALLHRTADQGPDRPLAVTFRPTGPDLDARAEIAHGVIDALRGLARSLPVERVTMTDVDACARAMTA